MPHAERVTIRGVSHMMQEETDLPLTGQSFRFWQNTTKRLDRTVQARVSSVQPLDQHLLNENHCSYRPPLFLERRGYG